MDDQREIHLTSAKGRCILLEDVCMMNWFKLRDDKSDY